MPHRYLAFGEDCRNVDTTSTLTGYTEATADQHQKRLAEKGVEQSME